MKPLYLSDIPIEETKAPEQAPPPLAWALSADKTEKAAWLSFWLVHPIMGGLNYLTHHALRLLSISQCSRFGALIAPFAKARFSKSLFAKRIETNLKRLRPDLTASRSELDALLSRWWDNIGRVFAEFSIADRHWKSGLIEMSGEEHFHAIKATGQPVVFVSAHVGHWETQGATLAQALDTVMMGIFQPEPNRFTNRLIYNLRRKRGQYCFPPGQTTAFRLRKLLQNNEASPLFYVDEVRDRQIHLPLFGRPLPDRGNAVAATKLAMATGAAILPVFMLRTSGAHYHLHIKPPLEVAASNDRASDIEATIEAINNALEPVVLENIDQWYMLAELRLQG